MFAASHRGIMLVLSSPSGAGKTSIVKQVLQEEPTVEMSISVTTRPQREGEIHGKDYFFVSQEEFLRMLKQKEFLEHAEVYGHFYGTPKKSVWDALSRSQDVIFDIDWQGTQQLTQESPTDLVSIFILPPSMIELESRLRKRALDSEEVINKRLNSAFNDLSHWAEYDYVIINDDFRQSVEKVRHILATERLKRTRQVKLLDFVNSLRNII